MLPCYVLLVSLSLLCITCFVIILKNNITMQQPRPRKKRKKPNPSSGTENGLQPVKLFVITRFEKLV